MFWVIPLFYIICPENETVGTVMYCNHACRYSILYNIKRVDKILTAWKTAFGMTTVIIQHWLNFLVISSCRFFKNSTWRTVQSFYLDVGSLLFCSLSRWAHTASVILRSGLWWGQSMTDSVPSWCIFFLMRYAFTALAVCLDECMKKIQECLSLWKKIIEKWGMV